MKEISLKWPLDVIKMSKNSICFQYLEKKYWMHRRVFNSLQKNKSLPTFVVTKELKTGFMDWIAVPNTLQLFREFFLFQGFLLKP